jgi:flagellar biosynthesis protein
MNDEPNPKRQVAAALRGAGPLPQIVASGHGAIAEDILKLAFEHGIKVREDADLAEILTALDLGEDIPLEALSAVSEILSRVYEANGKPLTPDDTP